MLDVPSPSLGRPVAKEQMYGQTGPERLYCISESLKLRLSSWTCHLSDPGFQVQIAFDSDPESSPCFHIKLMMDCCLANRPLFFLNRDVCRRFARNAFQVVAQLVLATASTQICDLRTSAIVRQRHLFPKSTKAEISWFALRSKDSHEIEVAWHDLMIAQKPKEHRIGDLERRTRVFSRNKSRNEQQS